MSLVSKIATPFKESYTELTHKVTWPSRKELTNSAIVVMIASIIIALVVFGMDKSFETILKSVYEMLSGK